jgi:type IV pilus assembly protein PilW
MKPVRSLNKARGLTLIEILVSLVIGLVVVGAVIVSYLGAGKASRYQSALSQMNQDAQIGLSMLSREVQLAGYSAPSALISVPVGGTSTATISIASYNLTTATAAIKGCDGTKGTSTFVDPTTSGTPVCAATSNPTTSGFGVVYEADVLNTVPPAAPAAQVPTDCLGNTINLVGTQTFYVARNRYYVAPGPSGRPELYCASNKTAGTSKQPLLENVEDMQIWYGIEGTTAREVTRYAKAGKDATTASTVNAADAATPGEWNKVISVRICLLMRSAETVFGETAVAAGNEDTLTYLDCDSITKVSTDRYLRRAYFTTATIRSKMAF